MINGIYMFLAFLVVLGVLIVVHEFGHFWVARLVGVKVLRFSVGFGKPLWRRCFGRDRTEFVVSAIPLGGYVKMLDEGEGEVAAEEAHRAFNRQSVGRRIAIVAAGPVSNLIFAVLAYWLVFMIGINGIKPVIGKVVEDSIAYEAGFREGDELLDIDDKAMVSWGQHRMYLFRKALDRSVVRFTVRDAQGFVQTRDIDLARIPVAEIDAGLVSKGLGLHGYIPEILAIIGELEEGPAKEAGLLPGDRIVEIDGQRIASWYDLAVDISRKPGRQIRLVVERDGQQLVFSLIPRSIEFEEKQVGRIGIRPQIPDFPEELRTVVRYGPVKAFVTAVEQTWSMSLLTVEMMYRMLRLEVSAKNISGPLTIAQYAGYSARSGVDRFLMFLAVVSISLGILNLLPIPILDGGHLMYYGIEVVRGRPVSEKTQAWGQQIGIALLISLMVLAFYNDITRMLM